MIRWLTAFLDFPADSFGVGSGYWQTITGTTRSPVRGERGQFATLLPPDGDAYLRVQQVLDGPAHVHLDLHVDDPRALADRAMELGATEVAAPGHVILRSPGGLPWCAVPHRGEQLRPRPLPGPDGAQSLVDQLAIDVPADRFETEVHFWTELTGWEHRTTGSHELEVLVRPEGMPLRLLFQRLGADDPGDHTRAHLDIAAGTHVGVLTEEHRRLGATIVRERPNWTTLLDPAGLAYCLTRRDPATGALPG